MLLLEGGLTVINYGRNVFFSRAALPFLDIKNAATPPSLTAYRTVRMLVTICDDDDSFVPKENLFISFTRENIEDYALIIIFGTD